MKTRGTPKTISSSICLGTVSPGSCPAFASLQHALFEAITNVGGTKQQLRMRTTVQYVKVAFAIGFDLNVGARASTEAGKLAEAKHGIVPPTRF